MNVPNNSKLNSVAQKALSDAVDIIDKEHLLKNGKTALYWHLLGIVESHMKVGDIVQKKYNEEFE